MEIYSYINTMMLREILFSYTGPKIGQSAYVIYHDFSSFFIKTDRPGKLGGLRGLSLNIKLLMTKVQKTNVKMQ